MKKEKRKYLTQATRIQNLLDKDFKDNVLKENEIIKAIVTEITKNYIVVDCEQDGGNDTD